MDLKDLEKIGLTEGERKVYQALLNLGECTKTALVKESKIPPSNLYDITNRLLEKGLISKVDTNGVAHFSPASPNRILDFLKSKKEEIDKEESLVKDLLPALLAQFKDQKKSIGIEVFVGWQGFKTVFEDLIEECGKDDQNYIFGASKGENEQHSDQFFLKYSKAREKKGIRTNIIFNKDVLKRKDRMDFFLKSKSCHVRFLDQSTPSEILLYKDACCIIILVENPLIIRIRSKEVSRSFLQYFNILWQSAKEI